MARSSTRILVLCLTAALAATCVSVARSDNGKPLLTSLIGGSCGAGSTPFAQWGDSRSYVLVGGGDFEPGGSPWALTGGARIVPGNEPFHVSNPRDGSSLFIPAGGTATSSSICFGLLNPGIRFFATASGRQPVTIHVQLLAQGLLGSLTVLDGGTATIGAGWAPTQTFTTLVSQLNVPVGSKSIELRLTTTGDVQIDDIYNDPFCSR